MMKRYAFLAALLVLPCGALWAANPQTIEVVNVGEARPGGGNTAAVGDWGQAGDVYIKHLDSIVQLTEEQKKNIAEINQARNKEMAEFQKNISEKGKAMSDALIKAYNSKDQEAIAKAQQEYQALYQPMHGIMKKYNERLDKALTVEQKAKLQDSQIVSMIKALVHPVQLTEQQIKAVKAAVPGEANKIDYMAVSEAVNNILTPEQKATINKSRVLPTMKYKFWSAKLTDDQMKQLEALCDQLVKDPNLSMNDLTEKLTEKAKTLLTPEQKAAMEKAPKPGEAQSAPFVELRR